MIGFLSRQDELTIAAVRSAKLRNFINGYLNHTKTVLLLVTQNKVVNMNSTSERSCVQLRPEGGTFQEGYCCYYNVNRINNNVGHPTVTNEELEKLKVTDLHQCFKVP